MKRNSNLLGTLVPFLAGAAGALVYAFTTKEEKDGKQ